MASHNEVKNYLAHWFQLGKRVFIDKSQVKFLPENIFAGDGYSQEFEDFWQLITTNGNQDAYIEGTDQTITDLLSPEWELVSCARCTMPVPRYIGISKESCPCHDLENWPNSELPSPNIPADNQIHLARIRERLIDRSDLLETPSTP